MPDEREQSAQADGENSAVEDLQFEHAEYSGDNPPRIQCSQCNNKIEDTYFQVGEAIVCSSCRWAMEGPMEPEGAGAGRLLRAGVYGLLAAAAGTAIYFGVLWVTNYEVGLIAVLVGWMVGKAVLAGSGNRGGRAFQVMAVLLTYCAIVTSYVPFAIQGMMEQESQTQGVAEEESVERTGDAEVPLSARSGSADSQFTEPAPDTGEDEGAAIGSNAPAEQAELSTADLVYVTVMLFGLVLISPFLGGLENVIGLFIIGIGLYQAWVGARSQQFAIAGPFSLGEGEEPVAKAERA